MPESVERLRIWLPPILAQEVAQVQQHHPLSPSSDYYGTSQCRCSLASLSRMPGHC